METITLTPKEKEIIMEALSQLENNIRNWPEDEQYTLPEVEALISKLR